MIQRYYKNHVVVRISLFFNKLNLSLRFTLCVLKQVFQTEELMLRKLRAYVNKSPHIKVFVKIQLAVRGQDEEIYLLLMCT